MNKIYNHVWNKVLGQLVVASELAKSGGKGKSVNSRSASRSGRSTSARMAIPLIGMAFLTMGSQAALADAYTYNDGDTHTETELTAQTSDKAENTVSVSNETTLNIGTASLTTEGSSAIGLSVNGVGSSGNITSSGTIKTSNSLANGVDVSGGAEATLSDVDINTTGDIAYGINVKDTSGNGTPSSLQMHGGQITVEGKYTNGLAVSSGSTATLDDGVNITATDASSNAVLVTTGATFDMTGGSINTTGVDTNGEGAAAFYIGNDTNTINLNNVTVRSTGATFASSPGATSTSDITVGSGSDLTQNNGTLLDVNRQKYTSFGHEYSGMAATFNLSLEGTDTVATGDIVDTKGLNDDGVRPEGGQTHVRLDGGAQWTGSIDIYGDVIAKGANTSLTINGGRITTTGDDDDGIYMDGVGGSDNPSKIEDTEITVSGDGSHGIGLGHSASYLTLKDVTLNATGDGDTGLYIHNGSVVDAQDVNITVGDSAKAHEPIPRRPREIGIDVAAPNSELTMNGGSVTTLGADDIAMNVDRATLDATGVKLVSHGDHSEALKGYHAPNNDTSTPTEIDFKSGSIYADGTESKGVSVSAHEREVNVHVTGTSITMDGADSAGAWVTGNGTIYLDDSTINANGDNSTGLYLENDGTIHLTGTEVHSSAASITSVFSEAGQTQNIDIGSGSTLTDNDGTLLQVKRLDQDSNGDPRTDDHDGVVNLTLSGSKTRAAGNILDTDTKTSGYTSVVLDDGANFTGQVEGIQSLNVSGGANADITGNDNSIESEDTAVKVANSGSSLTANDTLVKTTGASRAMQVTDGAHVTLTGGKVINDSNHSAAGRKALYVEGVGTLVKTHGTDFVTWGEGSGQSRAVYARDGAVIELNDGHAEYKGSADGEAVMAFDDATITTNNTDITVHSGGVGAYTYGLRDNSNVPSIEINGGTILATGDDSIGVMSQNDDGIITVNGAIVKTKGDKSYGVGAYYGGALKLTNTSVTTEGDNAYGVTLNHFNNAITSNFDAKSAATLIMDGGSITTTGKHATGLYVAKESNATLSDTSITTDDATTAEVLDENTKLTLINSDLSRNEGTDGAAVLHVADGAHADVQGGRIINNSTGNRANGLSAEGPGTSVTTDGTTITTGGQYTTAGELSRAVVAKNGATIHLTGGEVEYVGAQNGRGIFASSNAEVTTDGTDIKTTGEVSNAVHAWNGNDNDVSTAAHISLKNGKLDTENHDSYGLLAQNEGSTISAEGTEITTQGENSYGAVAYNGGVLDLKNVDISTQRDNAIGASLNATSAAQKPSANPEKSSTLTMEGGSISTTGAGADGLYITAGSTATLKDGTTITVKGDKAHAVKAHQHSTLNLDKTTLQVKGNTDIALWAHNDSAVHAQNVDIIVGDKNNDSAGADSWGTNITNGTDLELSDSNVTIYGSSTEGGKGAKGLQNSRGTINAEDVTIDTYGSDVNAIETYNSPTQTETTTVNFKGGSITTNGDSSQGVWVGDHGSGNNQVTLTNTSVTTNGKNSNGVGVREAGTATLDNTTVKALGDNSFGLYLENSATANLNNGSDIQSSDGPSIQSIIDMAGQTQNVNFNSGSSATTNNGTLLAVHRRNADGMDGNVDLTLTGDSTVASGDITDLDGLDANGARTDGGAIKLAVTDGASWTGNINGVGTTEIDGDGSQVTITGDSSNFHGSTTVDGGRLQVDGQLNGPVDVNTAGAVGGSGRVTGDVQVDGTLAPGGRSSPGTLNIDGNLTLGSDATSSFRLGKPGVVGGPANDLVNVTGDLTLDGTLNGQVASAGYYRLFNYGGEQSGSFDTVAITPVYTHTDVLTNVAGQVNLLARGEGQQVQFWDGTDMVGDGTVKGGDGAWNTNNTNWTGAPAHAGTNDRWRGSVAVFGGVDGGGDVTVEDTQSFDTLQFTKDGYTLAGGTLKIAPATGVQGIINVDSGVSTEIDSVITDGASASELAKVGSGTLTLAGANTYSGGTALSAGTLVLGNDNALGTGDLEVTGNAAIQSDADNRHIGNDMDIGSDNTLTVAGNHDLALSGDIGGTGALAKTGADVLVLDGDNTYSGGTTVIDGILQGDTSALQGNMTNDAVVNFALPDEGTYSGNMTGSGQLVKTGSGTLTLHGDNTYSGGTVITQGAVAISTADNIGTGDITLDNATLENTADATLAQAIELGSNGGTFETDSATTLTASGTISGAGSLAKTGAGTLVLTGDTSYSGPTMVNAGTLEANASDLQNTLLVRGDGIVAMHGGTVTTTGDATHGVLVGLGGTATLDQDVSIHTTGDAAYGIAAVGDDSSLTMTGGHITTEGAHAATVYVDPGAQADLDGVTLDANGPDSAGVYLQDNGTVTLKDTTVNSPNGPSILSEFTQQGQSESITATGSTLTDNDGTLLLVSRSDDGKDGVVDLTLDAGTTAKGDVHDEDVGDGTGHTDFTIEKDAAWSGETLGVVNLVSYGDVDYTGDEYQGDMVTHGDSNTTFKDGIKITGNITGTDNASFSVGDDSHIEGEITGEDNSSFSAGAGSTIVGDVSGQDSAQFHFGAGSTIDGNVKLDDNASTGGGTVDDPIHITGNTEVNDGAVLGGDLFVDGAMSGHGGTLSPGNSIGTQSFNTEAGFSGAYKAEVNAAGQSDLIIIRNGDFDLSGTALSVAQENGNGGYVLNHDYTIVRTDNGEVKNQFSSTGLDSSFNNTLAKLNPVDYGTDNVTVSLGVDQSKADQVAANMTPNQRATLSGLTSMTSENPMADAVLTDMTSDAQRQAATDELSGELHASTQSALLENTALVLGTLKRHMHSNLVARMRPGDPIAQEGGTLPEGALAHSDASPMWGEVVGSWATLDSDGNAAKAKSSVSGLFLGGDQEIARGWRFGGAVGYTNGRVKVDDRSSRSDIDSYTAALYGGNSWDLGGGSINFMAGAAYTYNRIESSRDVNVGGHQTLSADYHANSVQLFTELGYALQLDESSEIEPYVDYTRISQKSDSFTESGGPAALHGDSERDSLNLTTLGVRGQTLFETDAADISLFGNAGWRHASDDVKPGREMTFVQGGGDSFTVTGAPIAKDAAVVDVGVGFAFSDNVTIGVSYNGQYGGGNTANGGTGFVRVRF